MKRGLVVAGVVAVAITGVAGYPASGAGEWHRETVPSLPNVTSVLQSVSTGNGVTWAFGGWRAGRDPRVTQGFQRDAAGQWHEVPVPNVGEIEDSLVVSANDVWAVSSGSDETPVVHWDGRTWTAYPVTPPNLGATVHCVAAIGGQVWVAGSSSGVGTETQPLALWWDGSGWRDTGLTNEVMSYGQAIAGSSPGDVWAVGNGYRPGTTQEIAVALHWDGTQWTQTPLPAPEGLYLRDITAVSANDVWAVGARWTDGYRPVAVHWNGIAWSEAPVVPEVPGDLKAVASTGDELLAVGQAHADTATLVLRYDGTAWQRQKDTPVGLANDVTALPDGRPLLVGTLLTGPYQAENLAVSRLP